jgi:molybdopterin/thiamine biosynthesis adenylyltransferase
LAASGVGELTLCDHDKVDLSNLQRQILHRTDNIGVAKTASAQITLQAINPDIRYVPIAARVDAAQLDKLVGGSDVVLDCSDNFATRYAINRACLTHGKPLVSGAAIQFSGQAAVFDFRRKDVACYNCLFPEEMETAELRCATTGVFAPLVGMIGALQAGEALKLLLKIEGGLSAKLLTLNALNMDIRQISLKKDPACSVCNI